MESLAVSTNTDFLALIERAGAPQDDGRHFARGDAAPLGRRAEASKEARSRLPHCRFAIRALRPLPGLPQGRRVPTR
jgi:hypothetical protein